MHCRERLPQGGETICVVVGQGSITQLPQEIIDSGTQVIQRTQGGVDRAGDAACIERGQVDFPLGAGKRGFGWLDREQLLVGQRRVRDVQFVHVNAEGTGGNRNVTMRVKGHGYRLPSKSSLTAAAVEVRTVP